MASYTFGDDDPAVARLDLVASAYEPVSRAFIAAHATVGVEAAVDLGCGPGFSTWLLNDVCRPGRLVGVDRSSQFLVVARRTVPAAIFQTHDVTVLPLPGAPAVVIYSRLLLAHLPDPVATTRRWASQLAPGGVLLVEDLEAIDAPPGALRRYDEVSADIVRSGGGVMYAGAELASLGGRCTAVTVRAAAAARIYLFNVRRWRADPRLSARRDGLATLEEGLAAVVDDDPALTVSWVVRQIALRP